MIFTLHVWQRVSLLIDFSLLVDKLIDKLTNWAKVKFIDDGGSDDDCDDVDDGDDDGDDSDDDGDEGDPSPPRFVGNGSIRMKKLIQATPPPSPLHNTHLHSFIAL